MIKLSVHALFKIKAEQEGKEDDNGSSFNFEESMDGQLDHAMELIMHKMMEQWQDIQGCCKDGHRFRPPQLGGDQTCDICEVNLENLPCTVCDDNQCKTALCAGCRT